MFIQNDGCECYVSKYDGGVYSLMSLYTYRDKRNRGYAKGLLSLVKYYARKYAITIELFVGPFADRPMDKEQLLKFYTNNGFKYHRTSEHGTVFLQYNGEEE